ncbi:Methyltransferase domain-containing protein [Abditibacterium utsteinense]|uniref:Methyltransferase domain-containing protein n=1 Tax=Abditibacterium utsteinense TaxID=1960156 RepID=A0A2S8SQU7_9BACT|nr:class I SAM-dependent methyltransferase [Abditibacterium utsteinense]PQV63155.1 Methyltransferase domain-containing protein [Abditibacterium utsteinense]
MSETPANSTKNHSGEFKRWSQLFASPDFYYGTAPGPVARRAVRYHRPLQTLGGTALDAGSGEGQDTRFLAECNYDVTAVEWTSEGVEKSRRLLSEKNLTADLVQADLRFWNTQKRFDLVISINSLQFLGSDAPAALEKLKSVVAPGGVLGISVFGRENAGENPLDGEIYRWTLDEILANFSGWQPFEAARLWQWGASGPQPFVTLIAANF